MVSRRRIAAPQPTGLLTSKSSFCASAPGVPESSFCASAPGVPESSFCASAPGVPEPSFCASALGAKTQNLLLRCVSAVSLGSN